MNLKMPYCSYKPTRESRVGTPFVARRCTFSIVNLSRTNLDQTVVAYSRYGRMIDLYSIRNMLGLINVNVQNIIPNFLASRLIL